MQKVKLKVYLTINRINKETFNWPKGLKASQRGSRSARYFYKQEETQFKSESFINTNWFLNSSPVLIGDNSE